MENYIFGDNNWNDNFIAINEEDIFPLVEGADILEDDVDLDEIAQDLLREIDEANFCGREYLEALSTLDDASSVSDAATDSPYSNAFSNSPAFYSPMGLTEEESAGQSEVIEDQNLQLSSYETSLNINQSSTLSQAMQRPQECSTYSLEAETSFSFQPQPETFIPTPQILTTDSFTPLVQQQQPLLFATSSNTSATQTQPTNHPVQPTSPPQTALKSISHDQTKLCTICGNLAGMHSYYGANACNSCRAFFRRAVNNDNHAKFRCGKTKNCDINSKSWKSCQWCRFQKCLDSGMKVSWVLNDTERKERSKVRSDLKKKREEKAMIKQEVTSMFLSANSPYPKDLFTTEDEMHIREVPAELLNFPHPQLIEFYAQNIIFLEIILSAIYRGTRIPLELMQKGEFQIAKAVGSFISSTNIMRDIPEQDRFMLVSVNNPCVRSFVQSVYTDSLPMAKRFKCILGTRIKRAAEEAHVDEIVNKFKEISLNDTLQVRAVSYEQVFPKNWARDANVESRHRELTQCVREWIFDGKGGVADEVQLTLMNLIILFTPDFIPLQDAQMASTMQAKYAMLLAKYLKTKFARPGSKFCEAMVVSSICRELKEMKLRRWVGNREFIAADEDNLL